MPTKELQICKCLFGYRLTQLREDSILGAADLDDDFDPSEHDGTMEGASVLEESECPQLRHCKAKILGEDYDEMEEKLTSKAQSKLHYERHTARYANFQRQRSREELVRGPDGCNDLDISEAPTEGLRLLGWQRTAVVA